MKRYFRHLFFAALTIGAVSCGQEDTPAPAPTANFSLSKSMVAGGQTVSFTNLSTNATAWEWTFEGGTPATSTEQNPTVTYNTFGTYKVTLKASNGSNNDSKTMDAAVMVLPGDLLVYLPFNGTADDLWGRLNFTETSSTIFASDRTGKANSALGKSGELVYPVLDPKVTTEVSIATWLKPDVDMNSSTERHVFTLMGNGLMQCYYEGGRVTFEIYTKNSGGGRNVTFHSVTTNLTANTWYHVAVVIKKGEVGKVYLNGVPTNTSTVTENLQPDAIALMVGGTTYTGYKDFNGSMDEYMFFNRAISASEVDFIRTELK